MAGPWNADLNTALKYTDFAPTTSTVPTETEATAIWTGEAAHLEGELLAKGITISASGKDHSAAAMVEAMFASAGVQEAAEKKARGTVSQDTMELRKRAQALLDRWLAKPYALGEIGATVTRLRVQSMPVSYPNTDRDTSTYEAPLMAEKGYGVDEDL